MRGKICSVITISSLQYFYEPMRRKERKKERRTAFLSSNDSAVSVTTGITGANESPAIISRDMHDVES